MLTQIKSKLTSIMKFINSEKNRKIITLSITLSIIILTIVLKLTGAMEILELKGFDLLYNLKGNIPASEKVIFVNVDDGTLNELGKFPLSRELYGYAVRSAVFLGAGQVLFDIEFPERSSLKINHNLYKKALDSGYASKETIRSLLIDPDILFSNEIMKSGIVYSACAFNEKPFEKKDKTKYAKHITKLLETAIPLSNNKSDALYKENFSQFYRKKSFMGAIDQFFFNEKSIGFSNVENDTDGAIRRIPLFMFFEHDNKSYLIPQMCLNLLIERYNIDRKKIIVKPGTHIVLKDITMENAKKQDLVIPINNKGSVVLNWTGDFAKPGDFLHIPFHILVLFDTIVQERDKIIASLAYYFQIDDYAQQQARKKQLFYSAFYNPYQNPDVQEFWNFESKLSEYEKAIIKKVENTLSSMKKDLPKQTGKEAAETKRMINEISLTLKEYAYYNDVIEKTKKIKNAILFVGLTATSTTDIGSVPVNSKGLYPLVGVHANLANTIIQKKFIAPSSTLINIILLILLPLIVSLFYNSFSARISLLLNGLLFVSTMLLIYMLFALFGYWLDLVNIALTIFLTAAALSSYEFLLQETQKRYIKSVFGMYLSPHVIDQITSTGGAIELSGEEKELTAFFSDVAGFTSISEALSPTELVLLLNDYLTEMSDIILKHGGTIDKFEGDAIMAFYGAPVDDPQHAYHACVAAIEMKKRLAFLRENKWRPAGMPQLHVRMGMNSAVMRVGNMGSRQRMDYTIMGDGVNLASRLEGVNKYYRTEMMISEFTYSHVKDDFLFRELDSVRVVGKDTAIKIYELIDYKNPGGNIQDVIDLFYAGKELYKAKKFKEGLTKFEEALQIKDNDGPSLVFAERCKKYMQNPDEYTNVYSLTSK